ncbi:hypothetical protein BpHYR1_051068, partial [Brachionus plicatilis]
SKFYNEPNFGKLKQIKANSLKIYVILIFLSLKIEIFCFFKMNLKSKSFIKNFTYSLLILLKVIKIFTVKNGDLSIIALSSNHFLCSLLFSKVNLLLIDKYFSLSVFSEAHLEFKSLDSSFRAASSDSKPQFFHFAHQS